MKAATRMMITMSICGALFTSAAGAANWQDQLSSAANALDQNSTSSGASATGTQSATSLSTLTGLLNGGNTSLSSNSMSNAAGVLQYCMKNNLVDNKVSSVKDQLLSKLGMADTQKQQQSTDYQQGLTGLLNTGNNQQVNLKSLGDTEMGKKVKTKACDLVLKQGKKFIS